MKTDDINNHLLFYKFSMLNEILDQRNKKQNPEMKSITKGHYMCRARDNTLPPVCSKGVSDVTQCYIWISILAR